MPAPEHDWKQHPLFHDLSSADLSLLTGAASEVSFEAREVLFHEGDEAEQFYLILGGTVAIEVFSAERGPVTIQTVGSGEVLGWSWLIEPYRWHFDAIAVDATHAASFDAKTVRERFEARPDLGYVMMKRFVRIIERRLQATRLQLLDLYHVHT